MEKAKQNHKENEKEELTTMPSTDAGKAIAGRNAAPHGLFARDVVLPSLLDTAEATPQEDNPQQNCQNELPVTKECEQIALNMPTDSPEPDNGEIK